MAQGQSRLRLVCFHCGVEYLPECPHCHNLQRLGTLGKDAKIRRVSVPKEVDRLLAVRAKARGESVNDVIREAIEFHLATTPAVPK